MQGYKISLRHEGKIIEVFSSGANVQDAAINAKKMFKGAAVVKAYRLKVDKRVNTRTILTRG